MKKDNIISEIYKNDPNRKYSRADGYALLAEVREVIEGMCLADRSDVGMTEKRRIEKAEISGYNRAIGHVLQRLSERFS